MKCPHCSGKLEVVDTRDTKRQRRCKGCSRPFRTTECFDEVLQLTSLQLKRAQDRIVQLKKLLRSRGIEIPAPTFLPVGPSYCQPTEPKGISRT